VGWLADLGGRFLDVGASVGADLAGSVDVFSGAGQVTRKPIAGGNMGAGGGVALKFPP
jgi:hypothetical protein